MARILILYGKIGNLWILLKNSMCEPIVMNLILLKCSFRIRWKNCRIIILMRRYINLSHVIEKICRILQSARDEAFVDFDGLMCYASGLINGHFIGEHKGGYVPFLWRLLTTLSMETLKAMCLPCMSTRRNELIFPVRWWSGLSLLRRYLPRCYPACGTPLPYWVDLCPPDFRFNGGKSLQVDIAIAHDERTNKSIDVSVAIFDSRNRKRAELSRSLEVAVPSLPYRW